MDLLEINAIIKEIHFNDWEFHVEQMREHFWLQVRFNAIDSTNQQPLYRAHGRKWLLSRYMTRSEIVSTAFKAVLTAMEHETREAFLYRGRPVFGPHIDVESLHTVCCNLDVR